MMKIAFSTLGCPEWSWEDMVTTASDLGYQGIEVRGIENELYIPKAKPFLPAHINKTMERLSRLKLEIPCLTSSCYLFSKERTQELLQEGRDTIDLAAELGTLCVRVLGDANPSPGKGVDTAFVAENLAVLGDYAGKNKVKVLIETNGVFADSSLLSGLVGQVDKPSVGILWDIHHPFRYFNEPVTETYRNIKPYLAHIHIKDSVIENGSVRYKMAGHGDIPIKEALGLLKGDDFDGYISLEWVKRWCADLEDPGVVFSQFISYIRGLL